MTDQAKAPPTRVWLVGENNPYSRDAGDALLPYPERSAGWRLCTEILARWLVGEPVGARQ